MEFIIRCASCLPVTDNPDGGIVLDRLTTKAGAYQAAKDHDVATHGARVDDRGQRTNFTAIVDWR